MGARLADFATFGHLWGTHELRAVFDEQAVLQRWLDVLVALAAAQAEFGIVPAGAAETIGRETRVEQLDLAMIAAETRRTGHSTLGLIRGLADVLPPDVHAWVYYGVTVQDVTDTATALAIRDVGGILWRGLRAIEDDLLGLAERHRDTPMVGRTHGQPGAPITFGLKAASWADEVRRHLHRLVEGAPRWLVGQLGGAVGTLGFFDDQGTALRARFCARLGLGDPGVSWLTARDRLAEFTGLMAMVTATLARIGNEVYQLQRPELGEVREPSDAETVGSITMPHKRNPEACEHLVTLSRLVRANAQVVLEGMVGEHERDGRSWKAEWVAVPEICLLAGTAVAMAQRLVGSLEVNTEAMARGLAGTQGYAASERVLAALSRRLGKHAAQDLLQRILAAGRARGEPIEAALRSDPALRAHLDEAEVGRLLTAPGTGSAAAMVDWVVQRARRDRAAEKQGWP